MHGYQLPIKLICIHDGIASTRPLNADHRNARQIDGFHVALDGAGRYTVFFRKFSGADQVTVEQVDDDGKQSVDFHGIMRSHPPPVPGKQVPSVHGLPRQSCHVIKGLSQLIL